MSDRIDDEEEEDPDNGPIAEEEVEVEFLTEFEDRDEDHIEWDDTQGWTHEVQYGDPPEDTGELRHWFETFDDAKNYLDEFLYGSNQFFDIFFHDDHWEVWYMGGSE